MTPQHKCIGRHANPTPLWWPSVASLSGANAADRPAGLVFVETSTCRYRYLSPQTTLSKQATLPEIGAQLAPRVVISSMTTHASARVECGVAQKLRNYTQDNSQHNYTNTRYQTATLILVGCSPALLQASNRHNSSAQVPRLSWGRTLRSLLQSASVGDGSRRGAPPRSRSPRG